jgi:gliding motility-associatede transport system auxiliary component
MKWDRRQWTETIVSAGAVCLIAGYLRYSIQGELGLPSKILLIAGGVLLLAGVVLGFRGIVNFFSKRSSQLGTNTVVLTLAVIAILGILNYLGYRHHKQFDLTTEKLFTLSDQTKKVVGGLTKDVAVIQFDRTPNSQLDDLMTEYRRFSSHFRFQEVDPLQKPEVAKEYDATRMGDVIVAAGPRKEPVEPGPSGAFQEQDITSAILKVTRDKAKMVCFVTGHGEKSLSDNAGPGYSDVDQGLKKEGFNASSVTLTSGDTVPPDCDVLVVAGPTTAYFPPETALISKYLDAGGKALIEIDPGADPKLDDIFQSWNISVGQNVVIDASNISRMLGAGPVVPLVLQYGASPIAKKLQGKMTFFPLARTVSIADKAKSDPQAVELLKTSSSSFTKAKLEKKISYDAKTDTLGPLSLGVAASRPAGGKEARLVVIGDSDFASNQAIGQASNGDLFLNTIDWLAQDENLISIRPKSVTNRRVTLTEAQVAGLRWFDLFFLPGIVILAGIAIWWKRR